MATKKGTPSILLVGKSVESAQAVRTVLARQDYMVETALDIKKTINLLDTQSFDALIADIEMLRMNGNQVLKVLDAFHKDLNVIVMSSEEVGKVPVLKNQDPGILVKPFSNTELVLKLNSVLQKKGKLGAAK